MESGTESSKRDQDKASIADLIGAVVECWNRHDMRSLANLCAPDVDFVDVFGNWFKSRDEAEQALAARHATVFKASRFTAKETAIRMLGADFALAHAVVELSGAVGPTGNAVPSSLGVMTYVLGRSSDSNWNILAFQNTTSMPAPGAAGP